MENSMPDAVPQETPRYPNPPADQDDYYFVPPPDGIAAKIAEIMRTRVTQGHLRRIGNPGAGRVQ